MELKEKFKEAHILVKISAAIVMVTQIFNWIAFCSSSWYVVGIDYFSLWRYCSDYIPGFTYSYYSLSYTVDSSCSTIYGTASGRVAAAQAFAIFAFIALNATCVINLLYVFLDKCRGNKMVGLSSGAASVFSAVSWLLAVAILASYVNDLGTGAKFGYSFALAIVALILSLVAGVLMLMAILKGGSVGAI